MDVSSRRPVPRSFRFLRRSCLFLAGLCLLPGLGRGQINPVTESQRQLCDRNLNLVYQQALKSLPPARQAALRNAQRAWLDFRNKAHAAMLQTARQRGLTEDQIVQADTYELATRYEEIRRSLVPTPPVGDPRADYAQADASLNSVYKEALALLDEPGKKSVREAQRAWVAFRDADAKAAAGAGADGGINAASVLATTYRVAELKAFRAGTSTPLPLMILPSVAQASSAVVHPSTEPFAAPRPATPPPSPPPTPSPDVPDPFATVR